ncbi:hypothetical protein [Amaricoccus sp.]|uniref:hypothetical protein n=1 Tax=Amaricoccus sp. TaxID=1872485 RepID=UPI001B7C4A6B|nr:hypothetical protein [Amaricoccus sp.]MBP7241932.1 hypothetical protein [Amaricoccus sp.]
MATPLPVPAEPSETADGGPRLYGVIDILRADRVSGWAIDRTDAAAAVETEVLREGVVVARVRADRERRDLARGGVGSGRYGFSVPIDPPLEPGFEFTLRVRVRSADGATAELRRAGATISAPDPDRRLLERIYEELRALAARPVPEPIPEPIPGPDHALIDLAARLELTQIRIEAALAAVEPPPRRDAGGVRLVAGAALAIACGSLALGLFSLWAG